MCRDETIDIMKGIGIISVILGHMNEIPFTPYRNIIFSFHMPLFFIIGGYFFKPYNTVKQGMLKDAKKLLVPYIFTSFIILIFDCSKAIYKNDVNIVMNTVIAAIYASGSNHTSLIGGNLPAIGAIWFLFALFWCRFFYNGICKLTNNIKVPIIIAISVSAILIDRYLINLPFAILPGLSSMVFYLIGDYAKHHKIKTIYIFICLICWILSIIYSNIYMVRCYYGIYPIDVLGACGGTYFIYFIAKKSLKQY